MERHIPIVMEPSSTASAPSNLFFLKGTYVHVLPFVKNFYPRDFLYRLWKIIEDEHAMRLVFHGRFNRPATSPVDTRCDLMEFMEAFLTTKDSVFLIIADAKKDEIAGLIWFDNCVPGYSAHSNIFMRQRYWGKPAREAGIIGARYAFEILGLSCLWGFTPWKAARNFAVSIGFKYLESLPGYSVVEGKKRDMMIVQLKKEDFLWEV